MKQSKTLAIIVDSVYEGEFMDNRHLYAYHPLENLLLALEKKTIANDIAKELNLEPGQYCILSPVLFHTTHNDVFMIGLAEKQEQDRMYAALKTFLAEDGLQLHRYQDHLWLMPLSHMPLFTSEILPKVMHQSLKPFLDEWPLVWRQWFTEIQMWFHSQGFKTANGVWLWGQGELLGGGYIGTYPEELECSIPKHLLAHADKSSNNPAVIITKAKYLNALQRLRAKHIWYLWQNTAYWQHAPSLWQKIIKWFRKICT